MQAKPSFAVFAAAALLCALYASIPAFAQIHTPPLPAIHVPPLPAVEPGAAGQPAPAQSPLPLQTQTPFQTTVTTNVLSCFCFTPVPLPAGKRLIIQYISQTGAATTTSGPYIIPITVLASTVAGGPSTSYYFAPPQNAQEASQFYETQPVTIYADTLYVGPAFAGFDPNFDTFNVVISGYLVEQ
jgi:hypothetical protein